MDADFWHGRWSQNQIGFHQPEGHPLLRKFWGNLGLSPGATVLVPLCGKTLDMHWLVAQGFQVIGIELSALAVDAFFAEARLSPEISSLDSGHIRYQAGPITLYCGDILTLPPHHLSKVDAVYDRAALIALPTPLRDAYTGYLLSGLPAKTPWLLITVDYDTSIMTGPPFAIPAEEVKARFGKTHSLKHLGEQDSLEPDSRLREKGLTALMETVWQLHPNA